MFMLQAATVATVVLLACQFANCMENPEKTSAGMESPGQLLLRSDKNAERTSLVGIGKKPRMPSEKHLLRSNAKKYHLIPQYPSPIGMDKKHFKKSSGKHLRSNGKKYNLIRRTRQKRLRKRHGKRRSGALRIRGGNSGDPECRPYMAAILIKDRLWCAGAIVHPIWVLTAAHCLNYILQVRPHEPLNSVQVRVGSKKPLIGGLLLNVTEAIRHPMFEVEPPPHADIAMLKLEKRLNMSKTIQQIKLYEEREEPYAQSFVTVAGWGASARSSKVYEKAPKGMKTARLKVRTREYCMHAYELIEGVKITQDFFCASLRNGIRDICLFDAGSPAVQNHTLVGVMSFGPEKCGDRHPPAVFIKTYYFLDFVTAIIDATDIPETWIECEREGKNRKLNGTTENTDKCAKKLTVEKCKKFIKENDKKGLAEQLQEGLENENEKQMEKKENMQAELENENENENGLLDKLKTNLGLENEEKEVEEVNEDENEPIEEAKEEEEVNEDENEPIEEAKEEEEVNNDENEPIGED